MIAFVESNKTPISRAFFAIPNNWRTQSPMRYWRESEPILVTIDGNSAISETLVYGWSNFNSAPCSTAWYGSPAEYGQICITNSDAPWWSGFAIYQSLHVADLCPTSSSSSHASMSCDTDRKFSILVR